ncbi:hypothetical protein [Paenibacillus sp. PL2-23]|uniref:hypothetical protein n=1 Tax=Paenibacillus sp. PL2-23 TaxID=2100729 RepID=UPI0030F8422E
MILVRMKGLVVIMVILSMLSACASSTNEARDATAHLSAVQKSATATPDATVQPVASPPARWNRNDSSLSADGSKLLYNRKERKEANNQALCELWLMDLDSGQEMSIVHPNQSGSCHTFGWLHNVIYVQWNEFPSAGLTDFSLFDGKSGQLLESGWLYQYLEESGVRIVLLHSSHKDKKHQALGADIRIGALTLDGVFHLLFQHNVYEVQFLDIQLSPAWGAMTVLSHQWPTNSSRLWMAPIDLEQWTTGEWEAVDIQREPDSRTITYDQDGYVILSDGRRYALPWLE